MSYQVYIAREGFRHSPIAPDEWLAAARQCDELAVDDQQNEHGLRILTIHLQADKRAQLNLRSYGMVEAQDPSRDLILVMFKLATLLGAAVYSERLRKYRSIEDWERRTKNYRQTRDERRAKAKRGFRFIMASWVAALAFAVVAGWQLVKH